MSSFQQWTATYREVTKAQCAFRGPTTLNSKTAKTSHKNSRGRTEILAGHPSSPPPSPSPSLSSSLSQSALPLSYFCLLSVQSIPFRPRRLLLRQAVVGLTNNGRTETKGSLLGWRVTEKQTERDRERERGRQRERVALCVPLWLDSHLVAMCDRSSRANDGLPEASSIRPGLTGLPEREAEREMPIDMLVRYLCAFVYTSQSALNTVVPLLGCVCRMSANAFLGIRVHANAQRHTPEQCPPYSSAKRRLP